MELTTERIASDGSKMNSFQTSKTKVPFNMANFSLGYDIDSLSNIGASIGLMNFNIKSNGHPTTIFSGGMYGSGFRMETI